METDSERYRKEKHEFDKQQHGLHLHLEIFLCIHSQSHEWGYLPRVNTTFLAVAPILHMLELKASSAFMCLDDEVTVLSSSETEKLE
ncbi:hypothetical protein R1flu_023524 [Riccia fluitans]|uniref:Uncharacterized protein n=1 Tax=Riccia fluitans TaxID=41844 RepID=A0ABD1XSF3_9MARC